MGNSRMHIYTSILLKQMIVWIYVYLWWHQDLIDFQVDWGMLCAIVKPFTKGCAQKRIYGNETNGENYIEFPSFNLIEK